MGTNQVFPGQQFLRGSGYRLISDKNDLGKTSKAPLKGLCNALLRGVSPQPPSHMFLAGSPPFLQAFWTFYFGGTLECTEPFRVHWWVAKILREKIGCRTPHFVCHKTTLFDWDRRAQTSFLAFALFWHLRGDSQLKNKGNHLPDVQDQQCQFWHETHKKIASGSIFLSQKISHHQPKLHPAPKHCCQQRENQKRPSLVSYVLAQKEKEKYIKKYSNTRK